MALTATTLASAMTTQDLTIKLTATTNFAANQIVKIDQEYMVMAPNQSGLASGYVNVFKRGDQGTVVAAHNALAPVITSANSADFPNVPAGFLTMQPPGVDDEVTYSVNGAIALPTTVKNRTVILNKAGAAVMTLAAPPASLDGMKLTIIGATAQANTVTNTSPGFNGGGAASDLATFAAAIGNNLVLMASGGVWLVVSSTGITLS